MDKTINNEAFAQQQHQSAMRLCFEEAYKGFTLDTDPARAQRTAGGMAEAVKNASVLIPSLWGAAACGVVHALDEIKPTQPQTLLNDAATGIGKGLAFYTVGRACSPVARAFVRPGIQELTTRLGEEDDVLPEVHPHCATIESAKPGAETLREFIHELRSDAKESKESKDGKDAKPLGSTGTDKPAQALGAAIVFEQSLANIYWQLGLEQLGMPIPGAHFDFPALPLPSPLTFDATAPQQQHHPQTYQFEQQRHQAQRHEYELQQAFRVQEIRQSRSLRFDHIEKTEQTLMSKSTQFCTSGQTPAYRQMLDSIRRAKHAHTVRM